MQEVKRLFNPEFINRLDEIIIFNSLTNDDLGQDRGSDGRSAQREPGSQAADGLGYRRRQAVDSRKACKDKNYGARPLRRAIQRYIEDPLSEALIQGQLKELSNVEVYLEGTQLWYRPSDREEVGVPLTM